jgi:hypothetical protein
MTDSKYCVAWTSSASEVPAGLWDACFQPPLEGRWWYETLEKSGLEDQFTFLYAIILDCGRPIGLAPAFVMNVPIALVVPPEVLPVFTIIGKIIPAILHQRTLFVGSACSVEGTIGFLPGTGRRAALLSMQDALEQKAREMRAPMLVWKDFSSAFSTDLDWLGTQSGLFRLVSFPGAQVNLPSRNKDDYYAAMKASRRQKIKRKLRRSAEAVEISAEVIQRPDDGTLGEAFALFGQTYAKGKTKFERLDRTFFEIIAKQPESHFVLLREKATGKMLAFMLCFASGDRLTNKFIGIDYSRPKDWVLYFRLWDAAVDWALAKGFSSIHSGQTGYSAKIELGNRLVPLTNYCRHSNKLVHAIYRFAAKSIGWHTLDPDLAAHLKAHPEDADLSRGTSREPTLLAGDSNTPATAL